MNVDRIKLQIKPAASGYVVLEQRYAGSILVFKKELGMIHPTKANALSALESLATLTRQAWPDKRIEEEVLDSR